MRTLLTALLALLPLSAHDAWLTPDGRFHYGHLHPEQGEAKELAYDAAKLKQSCLVPEGAACLALYAELDSGTWAKTYDGTKPGGRTAHPEALKTWHSVESVTYLKTLSAPLPAQGFTLRIEGEPRVGERLRIITELNGKPLANIPVAYFGEVRGMSAEDGHVNIRLRQGGLQQITATLRQKGTVEDESLITHTLNFEVRP